MCKFFITLTAYCFITASLIYEIRTKTIISPRELQGSSTPVSYHIELTPYFDDEGDRSFTFDGRATLKFKAHDSGGGQSLELNSIKLTYTKIPVIRRVADPMEEIKVTNLLSELKERDAIIEFVFDKNLIGGEEYELEFEYTGQMIQEDYRGFYRSAYEEDGKTIWIGATQYQTRRMFPSFDEPKYKAVFNIIINKLKGYEAISNMNPEGPPISIDENRDKVTFRPTPIMSSYLVAFIVAPFKRRASADGTFGIWARKDQYDQTQYALDIGQKTLIELSHWTGIEYYSMTDIEKMDMAAIPDFAAGAMENWGLLNYKENRLLSDSVSTSHKEKENLASVIAHEQSHQWFGNLVTCETLQYMWLNEGFAKYFEYFTTDIVEPNMELAKQFANDNIQVAFEVDGTEDTYPMSDEDASTSIVYHKAGAILRMFEYYMGSQSFQTGVRNYLNDRAYKTAVPTDLFQHLENAAGQESHVVDYFEKWSTQPGHPVVYVELIGDGKMLKLSQKRFLYREPDESYELDKTLKWPIPITFTKKGESFENITPRFIFPHDEKTLLIDTDIENDWTIFNTRQSGFYRVNYDNTLWDRIRAALQTENFDGIDEINRGQIVDDILNLASSDFEDINYKQALEVISFVKKDSTYLPWAAVFRHASFLMTRVSTAVLYPYFTDLTSEIYEELSNADVSETEYLKMYNRLNVLDWACKVGNADCVKKSNELFADSMKDPVANRIDVNIRPAVLCSAIRQGGKAEYDFLWDRYLQEQVQAEKIVLLDSLGCLAVRNESDFEVLELHWNNMLSDKVRYQDQTLSDAYISTPENIPFIVEYIIKNVTKIEQDYVNSVVRRIIPRIVAENDESFVKLKAFIDENEEYFSGYRRSIANAIRECEYNKEWSAKNLPSIKEYLAGGGAVLKAFNAIIILCVVSVVYLQK